MDVFRRGDAPPASFWRTGAEAGELVPLVARFLGQRRTEEAFGAYARSHGLQQVSELKADPELVHFAETLLAGAIGSASRG